MSGTAKKATDVAFKASRNIDWDGMAKLLVSDEARKEFANLRRAFNEVNSQLQTKFSQVLPIPACPSSVDWRSSRMARCASFPISSRSLALPASGTTIPPPPSSADYLCQSRDSLFDSV